MKENSNQTKRWIVRGLLWGLFMFLTLAIVIPLLDHVQLNANRVLRSLLVWIIMGLIFGYTLHLIEKRKE